MNGWPGLTPEKQSVFDELEAQVECVHCHKPRWVPFTERFAGMQIVPKDIEPNVRSRCETCPAGNDFTRYMGIKRWRS